MVSLLAADLPRTEAEPKRLQRVLLISTYELGHQPFGLAEPIAWLRRAGHDVRALDLFFAGDTVRFEVTNDGSIRHEFYVGDVAAQEAHAAEMRETDGSGMAHDDPNGVTVEPGQTETLEIIFDEAGELQVGCHEPGHFQAGMAAPITVHP